MTETDVLRELEDAGYAFEDQLAPSRLADLVDTVRADVDELSAGDPRAGTDLSDEHRLFDADWIEADGFVLVGVVNRTDRGEWRLVYRLTTEIAPAPLSIALIFANDASWDVPADAAALTAGPLARPELLGVELDYQAVRWPVDARPDTGGHAAYVLRAFSIDGEGLAPRLLEDTPSPDRVDADLLAWVRENEAAIRAGEAHVPDAFLATRAVSIAPGGLARPENRAWIGLADDLDDDLLRRLDASTCQGCHAAESVAGMHLPGEIGTVGLGALASPISPHLAAALAWRAAPKGAPPLPVGSCDTDEDCPVDLACVAVWGERGECQPPLGSAPGAACQTGRFTPAPRGRGTPARGGGLPARRDAFEADDPATCAVGECRPVEVGFPGGMCRQACDTPGAVEGDAICADWWTGAFQPCLTDGGDLEECLTADQGAFYVPSCSEDRACRDGLVCAAIEGAPEGLGGCRPTYAMPQLRIDAQMSRGFGPREALSAALGTLLWIASRRALRSAVGYSRA